jgi:hypothetical protein
MTLGAIVVGRRSQDRPFGNEGNLVELQGLDWLENRGTCCRRPKFLIRENCGVSGVIGRAKRDKDPLSSAMRTPRSTVTAEFVPACYHPRA